METSAEVGNNIIVLLILEMADVSNMVEIIVETQLSAALLPQDCSAP